MKQKKKEESGCEREREREYMAPVKYRLLLSCADDDNTLYAAVVSK